MATQADIEEWEREWRNSRQSRDFLGARPESKVTSKHSGYSTPSLVSFRQEELHPEQRPRSFAGSIAKEEVDRALIRSMPHTSVQELLMRDAASRDTYSSLMCIEENKPKSFFERVRNKAREDDRDGLAEHIEPKDEAWLVHKYMEDLKVSRQDCKEARARIGQLVDKVKDLEKEVKCQKDMTAAQKKKVDDLQHERLEKERAFGSTNGTSATEHETRERCEELLRECALKDQIISLLQTENKSARMVQEAKSRDLDAKVAQLEAKLSAMSKCRDEGQPPSSA
jgi:hypothetical protein